jgi:hypothetical protein
MRRDILMKPPQAGADTHTCERRIGQGEVRLKPDETTGRLKAPYLASFAFCARSKREVVM